MRLSLVLLAALSCLVLTISASPIQIVEKTKQVQVAPEKGRQNEGTAPVEVDDDDDDDGEFATKKIFFLFHYFQDQLPVPFVLLSSMKQKTSRQSLTFSVNAIFFLIFINYFKRMRSICVLRWLREIFKIRKLLDLN